MRTLTLSRQASHGFPGQLTDSFWGPRLVMICRSGLRRHTDVSKEAVTIEAVTYKNDPGGNDVFDIRPNGTLQGVGEVDCDFQRWLQSGKCKGYKYLCIFEVIEE